MDNQQNLQRIAKYAVGFGLLIIVIWTIVHYLTTGKLTVVSDNPNSQIALVRQDDKGNRQGEQLFARKKLSKTLRSGTYIVTVEANSNSRSQTIKLEARKKLFYRINPVPAVGVEPVVSGVNAQGLAVDQTGVIYLDRDTNTLRKIDASNSTSTLGSPLRFQRVKWLDSTFSVGQGPNGKLYKIINGVVTPLATSFTSNTTTIKDYVILPDKQIYVASGSSIYAIDINGTSKTVLKDAGSPAQLTAGPGKVVVGLAQEEGASGSITGILSAPPTNKFFKKPLRARALSWSPNGRYLATAITQGGAVYDDSLGEVVRLPAASALSDAAWLDNNNLLYASKDGLWSYSLSSKQATLIANMPLAQPISEIVLSQDKTYAYLTVLDSSAKFSIKRVPLKGQPVSSLAFQLQNLLPTDVGVCSLNYINFGGITVTVSHPPFETSDELCLSAARNELTSSGIALDKIQLAAVKDNNSQGLE